MEISTQYHEIKLKKRLFHSTKHHEEFDAVEQKTIINWALNILASRHAPGSLLNSPTATTDYLRIKFSGYKNEVFCTIFLDNRHRVLSFEEMFYGTVDGSSVHPRVVVQRALEINAVAVIFAHNHPSGVSEPSQADEKITTRLKEALALVDIRVLDHIVIGITETTSFAERGLL